MAWNTSFSGDTSTNIFARFLHTKNEIEPLKHEVELPKELTAEFHRFMDLPLEIRHMIWGYARPKPQVVDTAPKGFSRKITLKPSDPVPALLHVSREAREFAFKKWYRRESGEPRILIDRGKEIGYFDPVNDLAYIYIGYKDPCAEKNCGDAQRVVALSCGIYSGLEFPDIFLQVADNYPKARELIILSPEFEKWERGYPLDFDDLVDTTERMFRWQREGEPLNDACARIYPQVAATYPEHRFNLTSFRAVELATNLRTCRVYGFMWHKRNRFGRGGITFWKEYYKPPDSGIRCSAEQYRRLRRAEERGDQSLMSRLLNGRRSTFFKGS